MPLTKTYADLTYAGKHIRIARLYPKTGRCEYCGTTSRRTDYAAARPGVYTENRADWFEFCHSCHVKQDGNVRKMVAARLAKVEPTCRKCGDADWYVRPDNGRRQCRSCQRRNEKEWVSCR